MSHRRPTSSLSLPAGALTRRSVLRGISASALAATGAGLLASCGTEGASQTTASCQSTDRSQSEKRLHFSNWPLYIDEAKVKRNGEKVTVHPTLERFEKQSSVAVQYVTDINDTRSSSGSCATSSLRASRPVVTCSCSPTTWPRGWSSSAGSRSSTSPTCPMSRRTSSATSRVPP